MVFGGCFRSRYFSLVCVDRSCGDIRAQFLLQEVGIQAVRFDFFARLSFGAGDAHAAHQFLAVELFARAVLFDNEGRGQDRPFITAEALPTTQTFPAAADAAMAIVGGIDHF